MQDLPGGTRFYRDGNVAGPFASCWRSVFGLATATLFQGDVRFT